MERCLPSSYASVFLWGIAVLIGLIGLGRLVALAIGGDLAKKAGWGLQAVWGMGAYLFLGGTLALFGACGQTGITLLILSGLGVWIWTTYRGGLPKRADFAAIPWGAWPPFAVIVVAYAERVCRQSHINLIDDLEAYFPFCEKLLETGSFDNPFSWRRLASLGGHTLLQCSVLSRGSWDSAQAFEIGICPFILLGLILGFRGGSLGRSRLGLVLGLVAVTTPIIRANTTSHLTGAVLFLGLFATLDLSENPAARRLRTLAAAGLVAAGMCSLRAQFIPAAVGALGLFWLVSWIKEKRVPREALIEALYWGIGIFAGLLPWMIMGILSNGSPLFPLFQGDNNLAFNPQALPEPLTARLLLIIQMFLHSALLPLLLCLLASLDWRRSPAARAVSIAAVLTSCVVAYNITLVPDTMTIARYVQPLLLAGALAVLMTAAVSPRGRLMAWALSILLVAVSLPARSEDFWNTCPNFSQMFPLKVPFPFRAQIAADHQGAQALIPEGKRVLVCADYPFLFDYRRNPVWIIDFPHAASPAPGLPFQKPPEETKRYLRKQGVEYLIFVDPEQSMVMYSRALWQKHSQGNIPLFRIQAPFFLDFFDTIEHLAQSETVLGRVGNLTVLHLSP